MPEIRNSPPVLLFMAGEWRYWSPLSPLFFLQPRMLGVPHVLQFRALGSLGLRGPQLWKSESRTIISSMEMVLYCF